jgi:hypothetical protein
MAVKGTQGLKPNDRFPTLNGPAEAVP